MAKGKREFKIESDVFNGTYKEFMMLIEKKLREFGIKYNENIKMYFNINNKTVYVVTANDNFKIKLYN
ncbi:hypothetical protein [uncultured Clostridium sp.]|uniref:hypothetical protein n=1 Tax=uncultured Clostridium sp. TaxID=59620 RepID=UPI00272F1E1E|nr:hypothetical protein [uncultured Clostridium sp.]